MSGTAWYDISAAPCPVLMERAVRYHCQAIWAAVPYHSQKLLEKEVRYSSLAFPVVLEQHRVLEKLFPSLPVSALTVMVVQRLQLCFKC
eukprot:1258773-Rhodomonas_salina.1